MKQGFFPGRRTGRGGTFDMKHLLIRTIAGTSLMLFGLSAGIQAQPPRDDDAYHRDRDDYYRGDRWRARMFDRVRDDLNHIQTTSFSGIRDEYRLERVKEQLGDLQSQMADHRYNERELDDVINTLQRVATDNHVSARDRDILTDDISRLRQFREHHDDWGAR
jgi:hypothetical protein